MLKLGREEYIDLLIKEWDDGHPTFFSVPRKGRNAAWGKCLPTGRDPARGEFRAIGLRRAFLGYKWNGKDYKENYQELETSSQSLKNALKNDCAQEFYRQCIEILNWGGVNNNVTRNWLQCSLDEGVLVSKIRKCVDLISNEDDDLDEFNCENLIMNSGLTKIISLASESPALMIYDGRVGAALGDFTVYFCESHGFSEIDPMLRFPWGQLRGSKTIGGRNPRDPSTKTLKFPRLFNSSNKNRKHAEAMRDASFILIEIGRKLGISLRQFEAGFFMWGYDVRSRRYLSESKL